MGDGPRVTVKQVGASTGEGTARGHTVLIDRPTSAGGADRGPMGGELILLGLGGCFLSNLLAAARERDAGVSGIEVEVRARSEGAPPRFEEFHMRVRGEYDDRTVMEKLVTIAERGCIATNTLRQGASVTVSLEAPKRP